MIKTTELKFSKSDLAFFDRQRDRKDYIETDLHLMTFMYIKHGERITAHKLSKIAGVRPDKIRTVIMEKRRYDDAENEFITANHEGYTLSFADCAHCKEDIIRYFNKTQTRFKETFNELCNLMKVLNEME